MKIFQPVVLAFITNDDKYLLTLRREEDITRPSHNKWQLPGGGLEFGETLEEGLLREIREEVSLNIEIQFFIPKITTIVRENRQGLFFFFLCKLKGKDQKVILNDEASDYGWFSRREMIKLPLISNDVEILNEAEKMSVRERS